MNELFIAGALRGAESPAGLGLDGSKKSAGSIETIRVADFRAAALLDRDATDDVQSMPLSQMIVAQRAAANSRGVFRRRSTNDGLSARAFDERSDEDDLANASSYVLKELRETGKTASVERMTAKFDALEEHTLLMDAMSRINELALPTEERERLLAQLQGMIDRLESSNSEEIARGVAIQQAYENALGTMHALAAPDVPVVRSEPLSELRAIYGQKDNVGEAPLRPLSLARLLQEKFGTENFGAAMGDLRSRMAVGLRDTPPATPGPRLWLSLGDAACFNLLQTAFAVAGNLRRELWHEAGVLATLRQTAAAILLLDCAESGGISAEALAQGITRVDDLEPLQLMRLYLLLYRAFNNLPAVLWSIDLLRQRAVLLYNLKAKAASSTVPAAGGDDEEELEKRLRDKVRRREERNEDDDEGKREDKRRKRGSVGRDMDRDSRHRDKPW